MAMLLSDNQDEILYRGGDSRRQPIGQEVAEMILSAGWRAWLDVLCAAMRRCGAIWLSD
jgi:hypothetical protein